MELLTLFPQTFWCLHVIVSCIKPKWADITGEMFDKWFNITDLCFLPHRAHLRALPDGGEHLHRLHHSWLTGGRLLLHVSQAQAADPAAHSLLFTQLPGGNHPHDPHHGSPKPASAIAAIQHGHHQLQFSRRRQLHAEVFSRRSGAAAARLPGISHRLIVSLHSHPDPTDSSSTSPLHIPTSTHDRRDPAPAAFIPHPAAAPSAPDGHSLFPEHQLPSPPAVLLPAAAWRLHGNQGLRWLWTELTGSQHGK